MSRTRSTVPAAATALYAIASVEAAVKATIRQVTSPGVRDVMWSAWTEALALADSPDRMPWERDTKATVITQEAAHLAMVRMLEAVADIESRCRIRNLLALECEFIETESTEGGRAADVLLLGGRVAGALAGLPAASPASRR